MCFNLSYVVGALVVAYRYALKPVRIHFGNSGIHGVLITSDDLDGHYRLGFHGPELRNI